MKILHSFIIITFFCATAILSQSAGQLPQRKQIIKSGQIAGIILDSLTNIPIEFASFQLILLNDTSKIYGTISDTEGKFILKDIPLEIYAARISSVGYKKRKRNMLVLNEKDRFIDLGKISLVQKNIIGAEIKVTGKNEEIVYEKEKLVVKVNNELGDNGLEILENTPMVNLDIDGNVNLLGKQST
ncbi:MAG: hypothetical protein WC061_10650, partial [Melioribacteraceae bacterium]